jgi:Glycosyl hydrolase family 45/ShK domain-like
MQTSASAPAGLTRRIIASSFTLAPLLAALVCAGSCGNSKRDTGDTSSPATPTGGGASSSSTGPSLPAGSSSVSASPPIGVSSPSNVTPQPTDGTGISPSAGGTSGPVSSTVPATSSSTSTPPGGTASAVVPPPEPCVDVEAPPNEEWPEANCVLWAAETTACTEDWFKDYCDVSCGRCIPEGGPATSASMTPVEPPPCVDVEPPPDPDWPGATCAEWSTESDACGEEWFKDFCNVSCGRCIPEGGLPEVPTAPDCSGEGLPTVMGGEGHATRYWDCCQPHCSQFDGHRCGQDGVSGASDQTSACNGGGSFACYDEAPRAVTECLSYGHIAKANPNCGACYRIQFTGQGEYNANDPGSKLIAGKQMVVKVTNTGGDVGGSQFDLMVPGGGVGQFNACSRQWGTTDLGAQYGGFLTECTGSHAAKKECVRTECMKIPAGSARDGCLWFVDWLQVADNPKFTSQQTDCPF